MKALSLLEVTQLLKNFQPLKGSQVQNIFYQGNQCLLVLWSSVLKKQYIFFDISKTRPFCFHFSDKIAFDKAEFKSPVGLFAKRHLKNKKLLSITMPLKSERILLFNFDSFFLEFNMIPHFANIKVSYNNKSLRWYKEKKGPFLEGSSFAAPSSRNLLNIQKEWLGSRPCRNTKTKIEKKQNTFILFLFNKIKKTQRALVKNEKDIKDRASAASMAQDIALKLRVSSSLSDLNQIQITYIKKKQSWAWNMDNQFNKYKKLLYKLEQTQSRQKDLKKEIKILNTLVEDPFLKNLNIIINLALFKKCKVEKISQLLLQGEKSYELAFKKGFFKKFVQVDNKKSPLKESSLFPGIAKRSLLLDSGTMVVAGKNAKANIDLLRQAKPWYTWVHLRDYPSSHAIVLMLKVEKKITDKEIIKIGQWLAETSLKKGNLGNIKLDIIYTQCRFVKSIKGDSLGRVSYKNEKTILL